MDIRPEYETFGRDVPFEYITQIRSVAQPGILNQQYFFNPDSLSESLSDMYILFPKTDEILVYFRNISGGIGCCNKKDENRKWWDALQKFKLYLGTNFPAGLEMEYYYNEKEPPSPEFRKDKAPYQAFIKLFNNAIQGFSCFVGESNEGIRFSSHRTNYGTIKHGEGLINDQKTLWTGTAGDFLASAVIMDEACRQMRRDEHNVALSAYNIGPRAEIRIIDKRAGFALIGSLVGSDSLTLLIDRSSLEKIVERYNKERISFGAMPTVQKLTEHNQTA